MDRTPNSQSKIRETLGFDPSWFSCLRGELPPDQGSSQHFRSWILTRVDSYYVDWPYRIWNVLNHSQSLSGGAFRAHLGCLRETLGQPFCRAHCSVTILKMLSQTLIGLPFAIRGEITAQITNIALCSVRCRDVHMEVPIVFVTSLQLSGASERGASTHCHARFLQNASLMYPSACAPLWQPYTWGCFRESFRRPSTTWP